MIGTRRRSRALYLSAAAILLAVAVAHSVIWAIACRRLETGARDAAVSAGWILSAGPAHWGGWPVAAEITLPDAALRSGPTIIPPLTWTAPRAVLGLSAWHPTALTVSASGTQTLTVGAASPVPFTARDLRASIDLTAHDPVRVNAADLDVTTPDGPVTVKLAELLLPPDGVSADLSGLTFPGHAGQPITPSIDTLRVDARITPPIEPNPVASESARQWRSRGGTLEIGVNALRWSPLDATAHATLTLDQSLQPELTGQLTVTGLAAVIEQLAQTGAVTRSAATAAQGMLAILAAPTAGGPVTLPVTLRGGIVTVARIPLVRIAPLRWD